MNDGVDCAIKVVAKTHKKTTTLLHELDHTHLVIGDWKDNKTMDLNRNIHDATV